MIIIIPLGGKGERFKNLDYNNPKPLIKVLGKNVLCWLIDNLDTKSVNKIVIPYNSELKKYRLEDFLVNKYRNIQFKFIELGNQTRGACESVLFALNNMDGADLFQNIMCCDGDNFFTDNITKLYLESDKKNSVFYFEDASNDAIYSYISLDKNGYLVAMAEKNKISNNACCGVYCFESGIELQKYCKYIVDHNILQKGEFYMSNIIKVMLDNGHKFNGIKIDSSNFICLGTPLQVKIFCNNVPKISAFGEQGLLINKYRICFDLDNTLVTYPKIAGDYTTVEPIKENINFLKYLKKLGQTIIIYTARRMKTHDGNNGKALKDIGKITFDTLEKFDIPYDEIYFGKPYADFYIDDLAVNCFNNLEKELGFYQTIIDPRSFNEMKDSHIQTCVKKSDNAALKGEIYWYLNIPPCIKDMFPILIRYDENKSWYEMEKIIGIPVSKIFLSGEMTVELLGHIFGSLERIHSSANAYDDGSDIYANYLEKIKKRFDSYNYSVYQGYDEVYGQLLEYFEKYRLEGRGEKVPIHGDPVLTNIIVNQFGKIKFIDMRGIQGDKETIWGDKFYDYGKLYQSLIGYDEILEGKNVMGEYKNILLAEFEKYIVGRYGENRLADVKMIAANLLFSLIPLHKNDKCVSYYNLCKKIMNK